MLLRELREKKYILHFESKKRKTSLIMRNYNKNNTVRTTNFAREKNIRFNTHLMVIMRIMMVMIATIEDKNTADVGTVIIPNWKNIVMVTVTIIAIVIVTVLISLLLLLLVISY